MDFIDNFENKYPHRISKPMSLNSLIDSILTLEKQNIISFEDFKKLSFYSIKQEYFGIAHPTQLTKAMIKIEDLKQGKTTPSSLTTVTEYFKDGKVTKVKKNTTFF